MTTTMMMTTTRTKTDSSAGSYTRRPHVLGAAVAFALLLSGCNSHGEVTSPTAETQPTTDVTTAISQPDPAELLASALDNYRDGYEFVATIAVNDQEAVVQTGRWLDDASQLTVRSGDGEVEYIVNAAGQWARLPDGDWEEIDGAPETTFPLASMATPQSVELMAADGGIATVRALYPADTMGLTGDPVEVVLDFRDGVLVGMSFTADIDGNITESTTSLSSLTNASPITVPAG